MSKRLFILLLTLFLLAEPFLGLVPAAQAASSDAVTNSIVSQFDAYAAKLAQSNSANDCVDALLYPAIFGNGSAQSFGESSAVTAAIYNSKLFREFMVKSLPVAVENMQDLHRRKAIYGSGINWYNAASTYAFHEYIYNETADTSDDVNYAALVSKVTYTGSVNRNDQAMMLVGGSTDCRMQVTQVWASDSQIRYRIDVTISDVFDFGSAPASSAGGFNTVYIKMLNTMGKLLRLKTFKWSSKSSFELTVPNFCPHSGGNYRWETTGNALVNVSGDGLTANKATNIPHTPAADGTPRFYYELEKPIALLHDQPWTVELRMKGSTSFSMTATENFHSTGAYSILKLGTGIYGIECFPYYHWEGSKRYTYYKRHQHGIPYGEHGIRNTDPMTLVLENRVAENGSNQVWLTINEEEVGPMIHYAIYDTQTAETATQSDTPSWLNGKDFFINYLFNMNVPARGTLSVYSVDIQNNFPCVTTKTTEATCTAPATETASCTLCGGSWTKETAPALGHTEEALPGTAATCTETGLTAGKKCTVCGETTAKQETIPALGHKEEAVPGKTPTCLEEGLSDGKLCTVCGTTTVAQEVLPATGHSPETVPGKAPTCLEEGLSDGSRCTVCGETLTIQEALPATGHTEGPMTEKAPTCSESGLTGGSACTTCGTVLIPQEIVPTLPHTEQTLPGKAPTCSESGLTEGTACAVCGTILTAQQTVPTLPHTPEVLPGKAPSCTEDGLTEGSVCAVCGAVLTAQQPISAAHTWDEGAVTTKPTTETPGIKTYTCTLCGATREEELPIIEASPALWGDVNRDGKVNFKDSVLILQYASGRVEADQLDLTVADVNGDEKHNFKDAVLILQKASGRIDTFPVE